MLRIFKAKFVSNFTYRFIAFENLIFGYINNLRLNKFLSRLPVSFLIGSPK
jgi:hypothetical protein